MRKIKRNKINKQDNEVSTVYSSKHFIIKGDFSILLSAGCVWSLCGESGLDSNAEQKKKQSVNAVNTLSLSALRNNSS